LQQSVCQSTFTVVNMSDDTKISYVLHFSLYTLGWQN